MRTLKSINLTKVQYNIVIHEDGIFVMDELPLPHLGAITALAGALGYDMMYPDISQAIGAVMAISNDTGADRLRAEIKDNLKGMSEEDQWFNGTDAGLSSKTIWCVIMGRHNDKPAIPGDPADFARCYRLLEQFPSWRGRLQEVADAHPQWQPLVDHWGTLEDLYREESFTGLAPKLHARLKDLNATATARPATS